MSPSVSRSLLLVTALGLAAAGCAGMSPMQSGYLLGSIAGGAAAGPAGAALGSAVGTLAGALVAKPIEQRREHEERKALEASLGTPPAVDGAATPVPAPAAPEGPTVMARVWVDERLERGRVLTGRFEDRPIPQTLTAATPKTVIASRPL